MAAGFRVLREKAPYISCYGLKTSDPSLSVAAGGEGAMADALLAGWDLGDTPQAYVAVGATVAFHLARHEQFDAWVLADHQAAVDSLPAMLPGNVARGLAVVDHGMKGLALVMARTAALAQGLAKDIQAAITPPGDGALTTEEVWEALTPAARLAGDLRGGGDLQAAVVAFRGRGRVTGPINPDMLIRYRVSEWR